MKNVLPSSINLGQARLRRWNDLIRLAAANWLFAALNALASGALQVQWATNLGAALGVWYEAAAICVDPQGNSILTGRCRSGDLFAATYSPSGTLVRVFEASAYSAVGCAAAADAHGIWIAGDFYLHLSAGGTALTASNAAAFVARLDPNGDWLWAAKAEGVRPVAIAPAAQEGACYLVGSMLGTARFGSISLTNCNGPAEPLFADMWVAKLDAAGHWVWARRAGSPWHDRVFAIVCLPNGKIVMAGDADWNTEWQTGNGVVSTLGDGLFLACYRGADGSLEWVRHYLQGPSGAWDPAASARALAVTSSNTIQVAGLVWESAWMGGQTLTNAGQFDLWQAEFSDAGDLLSARQAGGVWSNLTVSALAVNAHGEVAALADFGASGTMVAGRPFVGDAGRGLLYYHPRSGDVLVHPGVHDACALALDNDGAMLVAGNFCRQTRLGRFELRADDLSSDTFLLKAQCVPVLAIRLRDGHLVLSVSGRPGSSYEVLFTDDLQSGLWRPLTRVSLTNGLSEVMDPEPATQRQRYYRAVETR